MSIHVTLSAPLQCAAAGGERKPKNIYFCDHLTNTFGYRDIRTFSTLQIHKYPSHPWKHPDKSTVQHGLIP